MNFQKLSILSILLLIRSFTWAQQDSASSKKTCRYAKENYFNVGASGGNQEFLGTAGWSHLHRMGKKKRFAIGYGIRYSGYVGGNKFYTTAPSKYTSTRQDLLTIFSDDVPENIDTISVITSRVNSINLSFHLQYTLFGKLDLGTNIDLIGFSFGRQTKGSIMSSSFDGKQAAVQNASPTPFNVLLTSDNDRGSLNSEFYGQYWLHKKWAVKLGYTFYFSELTTAQNLSFDNGRIENDRYRLKSSMILLGVTFKPFN
jgi:hypothetical protein